MLVAGLLATACNMNEIVEVTHAGDEICFNITTDGATKALDVTTANLTSFNVTAFVHNTVASPYINNVAFSKASNVFNSASAYYWPYESALDFYAWSAGSAAGQVTRTDFRTFTVAPSSTPASQADLVYACATNQTKAGSTGGAIPLNFRHAMSKVVVKAKNTAPNLKFQVTGWRVGYLDADGVFTYNGNQAHAYDATTVGAGTLAAGMWSGNTSFSADNKFTSDFTASPIDIASGASATAVGDAMILVPQSTSAATAYASTSASAAVNGSYIALEIKIMNNDSAGTVVQPKTWAIWPVALSWAPGMQYTYTVDLAGGGYFETNTSDGNADLDPILENGRIFFVSVTADTWSVQSETNLSVAP